MFQACTVTQRILNVAIPGRGASLRQDHDRLVQDDPFRREGGSCSGPDRWMPLQVGCLSWGGI